MFEDDYWSPSDSYSSNEDDYWSNSPQQYNSEPAVWSTGGNENYSPYGGSSNTEGPMSFEQFYQGYAPGEASYGENPGSYTTAPESISTAALDGWSAKPLSFEDWLSGNSGSSALSGIGSALGSLGNFLNTSGGQTLQGLLGAGLAAYGANKQNKQVSDAQKAHDKAVAEAKAQSMAYNAPLRLANPRTAAAPQARQGASTWFNDNRVPGYFAEGGLANITKYAQGLDEVMKQLEEQNQPRQAAVASPAVAKRSVAQEYADEAAKLEAEALARAKAKLLAPKKNWLGFSEGGSNYVQGGGTGQSDKVPAMLSDGEYVMDADVVSALGDGNNIAGAKKLDQMRTNIRAHKRSASPKSIPPKAKSAAGYLKGAK